tara:strand:+ start:58 stop:342 length:285 start_codon:yes stop_codon:yes gene_type:complete
LLEKAWAKTHGSYHNIVNGTTHDALRDLTGAPSNEYPLSGLSSMYISIQFSIKMSYIVTLGSQKPDELSSLGLDPNYNYSVIDTSNAKDQDGNN